MKDTSFHRTVLFLVFIMFALTPVTGAGSGDEPPTKATEQWSKDLKRLVMLSRLVANEPSLLSAGPSTKQIHKLSVEPFGCGAADLSECLLSQISSVLMQQTTGSAPVFDATQGAALQLHFQRATDVWADKYTENNWDVAKKWTDALGPVVLIVGAILLYQDSSSHAGTALVASGAGLILIGNIGTLGQMFGGVDNKQRAQIAKKTIDTLQDIDASRQTYEDSQLIYGFLDSYSAKSKNLLSTLAALSNEAKDLMSAAPSLTKSKRIVELCDKTIDAVSSFKVTAGFTADYADQLLKLYIKNQGDVSSPDDKKKYEDARQSLIHFAHTYDEGIAPFLEGIPDEIEAMQNIKAGVIADSIAHKQYF